MSRHDGQTPHEKRMRFLHPAIRDFMAKFILPSYVDTSRNQNYIGAEAAAYQNLNLPIYEWKGPGEVVQRQLIATAPQFFQAQQVVPTGLAGIAAGQIWNGGLIDNPNNGDTLQQEIV